MRKFKIGDCVICLFDSNYYNLKTGCKYIVKDIGETNNNYYVTIDTNCVNTNYKDIRPYENWFILDIKGNRKKKLEFIYSEDVTTKITK